MEIKEVTDRKKLIGECFSSDRAYIHTHKLANKGLDACINCTFGEIKDLPNYKLFAFIEDNNVVGMFGIENNTVLNPFFIKPIYRNRYNIGQALNMVRSMLNKKYIMGLYDRNPKAIEFFKKNGGNVLTKGLDQGEPTTILIFENGRL